MEGATVTLRISGPHATEETTLTVQELDTLLAIITNPKGGYERMGTYETARLKFVAPALKATQGPASTVPASSGADRRRKSR